MAENSLNIPNLDKLIAHMRTLRPDQFDMTHVFRDQTGDYGLTMPDMNICGTAACIAGECAVVADHPKGKVWYAEDAARWLGLGMRWMPLFEPPGYEDKNKYPLPRAIDVLCHLRGTNKIRWDLFPAENYSGQPWSAPRAVEITPPALPETLTRLLAAQPAPTATEA